MAEIMDPEDMPASTEAIDEAEKQKLEERLRINDLVKHHSKGDSFYICIVKATFYELCKRDADFRNMMTAIAFKKVCDAVGEWQTERIKIESDPAIIHLINKAFDNIQEAQKGSRKRQNVTMEI